MPSSGSSNTPHDAINRALTSISVASAHVQLVRRWLERGHQDRAELMLESLRTSEHALRESAATIREIGTMEPERNERGEEDDEPLDRG
jgi:hypothetical protein